MASGLSASTPRGTRPAAGDVVCLAVCVGVSVGICVGVTSASRLTLRRGSLHGERHLKIDVLAHRVPHGAILVARELDRALHLLVGHVAVDVEVQGDAEE